MDTKKWKSVAIRREIVDMASEIGEKTERPTSNVFAFAVKRLKEDLEKGKLSDDWLPDTCTSCMTHWKLVDIVCGPDDPRFAGLTPDEVVGLTPDLVRRFVGNNAKIQKLKSEARVLWKADQPRPPAANCAEAGDNSRGENASVKKKGKSGRKRR